MATQVRLRGGEIVERRFAHHETQLHQPARRIVHVDQGRASVSARLKPLMVAPVNLHKLAQNIAVDAAAGARGVFRAARGSQMPASLSHPRTVSRPTRDTMQLHEFLVRQLRPEVRVPLAHERHDLGLGFNRELRLARSARRWRDASPASPSPLNRRHSRFNLPHAEPQ